LEEQEPQWPNPWSLSSVGTQHCDCWSLAAHAASIVRPFDQTARHHPPAEEWPAARSTALFAVVALALSAATPSLAQTRRAARNILLVMMELLISSFLTAP